MDYIICAGDTLSVLARLHGITLRALLQANPAITNPDRISLGQKIVIPEADAEPGSAQPPSANPPELAGAPPQGNAALEFSGPAARLTGDDVDRMAQLLGTDSMTIWAICDVESSGGGFLPDGRPKILFEAHVFGRLTYHRFDRSHPNISAPRWDHALYGAGGAHQYDRLHQAISLDRMAALESASWGMFQTMGLNYVQCGFANAEEFVRSMCTGERGHLTAFGAYCRNNGLLPFLRSHDWTRFALHYNGLGEEQNHYHERLAAAFGRRSSLA